MIGVANILLRAPIIRVRHLGLIDVNWPLHRHGSLPEPADRQVTRVERRFRRGTETLQQPGMMVHAPVSLAVTNLALSPRFTLIWQNWRRMTTQLERYARVLARGADPRRPVMIPVRTDNVSGGYSETRLERTFRIFAALIPGEEATRSSAGSRDNTAAGGAVRGNTFRQARGSRLLRHLYHRLVARLSGSRFMGRYVVSAPVQTWSVFTAQAGRALQIVRCAVIRRQPGFPGSEALERPDAGTLHDMPFSPRSDLSFAAGRPALSGSGYTHADAVSLSRSRSGVSPQFHSGSRPAERIFRTEKPAPLPVAPAPAIARPASVQQSSRIDIAGLDNVLWQRFEKRLRIEMERRGRG